MNRYLTSRLAAHAGTRQTELLVKSDAAGESLAKAIRFEMHRMLEHMREGAHNHARNFQIAEAFLRQLPYQIWHTQRMQLAELLLWAHDRAAESMMRMLPRAYLRAAGRRLPESMTRRLREHGPIVFGITGTGEFTSQYPLPNVSEEEAWRRFLFPPPAADQIRAILDQLLPPAEVQGSTFSVLGDGSGTTQPMQLASFIAQNYAAGQSTHAVARAIRPVFDGSAMRAERTARTLGAYIGTERNLAVSNALGDMIVGYQVHSVGGETARHSHALRSGTIYYKNPKPGQWGMDVMPHPPQDTQRGPHDDMQAPRGLCYNCRCWLTPVLAPLPAMDSQTFTDNADRLIPDPATFADWFAQATPAQQQKAAGPRRLSVATDLLGRSPTWSDLVDPSTGTLLTLDELRAESVDERAARRAQVQAVISTNRALIRRVATYGGV